MAAAATPSSLRSRVLGIAVSLATALVILGASIVPLFTPQWIRGEQLRSSVYVPGYSDAAVQSATDATVGTLLFGGDFAFKIDPAAPPPGTPVNRYQSVLPGVTGHWPQFFDEREVGHMNDVRGVFRGLGLLILGSAVLLLGVAIASGRSAAARLAAWRAVGRGAGWLAVFMVAVGVLSIVAFDAAFQVFHELVFPAGSFTFDPAKEHLVQLFPDQFWAETSLALGIVALTLSIGVAIVARRRAGRFEPGVAATQPPGGASAAAAHVGSPT